MTDKSQLTSAVSNAVDKLGADPCLLAIVLIVVVCAWAINRTYKHVENLERIRLSQTLKALGKEGKRDLKG